MPTESGYGGLYQRRLKALRSGPPQPCAHCQQRRATTLDHDPPLAMHVHRDGARCCRLVPSCEECNRTGGIAVALGTWRSGFGRLADPPDPAPEPAGIGADDRRWRVPWLGDLLEVPASVATWPRYMTAPHPRAVGSYGAELERAALGRTGKSLRWWQKLVARRLLEHDDDGALLWEALVMSVARQCGKSWLLRELCVWRMSQAERFGEPQDILHTGKDIAICKEVQRPARVWAKARPDHFKVREVNGQEEIERLEDGSRWLLRAREAVYGYAASMGAVDEAWKVRTSTVDDGLLPTMAERVDPQLLLISTAHRMATGLMLGRRAAALERLEAADGDLLIEWSAPRDAELEDETAWRAASPAWSPRRRRIVAGALERALSGESVDPEEPDPLESFRAQWLNCWPARITEPAGATEELLPPGAWSALEREIPDHDGPVFVAVEDDFGLGAAIACARRSSSGGPLEVDGWVLPDWDAAIADVLALLDSWPVRRITVGAALADRARALPRLELATSADTRHGLALVRDLAAGGAIVHDGARELAAALGACKVRESSTGLHLVARGPTHLVKALAWALVAAHAPAPAPAVH